MSMKMFEVMVKMFGSLYSKCNVVSDCCKLHVLCNFWLTRSLHRDRESIQTGKWGEASHPINSFKPEQGRCHIWPH